MQIRSGDSETVRRSTPHPNPLRSLWGRRETGNTCSPSLPPVRRDGSGINGSRQLHVIPHSQSSGKVATASTAALVPSFCSTGTILPSRPAHRQCRRARRPSRMARLRATASAARSVLDTKTPSMPFGSEPTSSTSSKPRKLTASIAWRRLGKLSTQGQGSCLDGCAHSSAHGPNLDPLHGVRW
jgi:hypothetical protein